MPAIGKPMETVMMKTTTSLVAALATAATLLAATTGVVNANSAHKLNYTPYKKAHNAPKVTVKAPGKTILSLGCEYKIVCVGGTDPGGPDCFAQGGHAQMDFVCPQKQRLP
jgi:hypothetical protein